MLVSQNRPRNLNWFHSGPLLFGDWGTSRLYVLGLAFFFTAHASIYYLLAMGVVMAGVAWAYTIVCREFPDGGGVYSSAQRISQILAVVGATLLLCDYIVTASLSTVEAFHYFGAPNSWVLPLSIVAILLMGLVNWYGSKNAGRFALLIAVVAMGASLLIALLCLPFVWKGIETVSWNDVAKSTNWQRWTSLVSIMLALSGVEAVSNMTGMMKQPVAKTSKRTIWPVLAEVVIFNAIFGLALAGLPMLANMHTPDALTYAGKSELPPEVKEYRDTALRVLAIEAGQHHIGMQWGLIFGKAAAVVFGLLLLSATNTVIMGIVSVTYALSRDRELPSGFSKLNYAGVPWWGLIFGVLAPIVVLLFGSDVQHLADLYAVGVVGAISINIACCVLNKSLKVSRLERGGLALVATVMIATECTIIVTKPHAAYFAGGMVLAVLGIRWGMRWFAARKELPTPAEGWLSELKSAATAPGPGPRIMLAARGRDNAEFAVDMARRRQGSLFGLFVRRLQIVDIAPGKIPRIEDDQEAQEALGTTALLAKRAGVPFVPIYVNSADVASEILDYTVTFGCDTLIMGKTQRSEIARRLGGDVVALVATHLPEGVSLVTRASARTSQELGSAGRQSSNADAEHEEPPPS
jgi:amino acid transporter